MQEDLSRFCCLNPRCPDHGKRGAGNLTVCARYGKDKRRRMLYCRSCKARFSERKGTPLFGSQLTEEKAISSFEHLAERNGVRATARLVKVNRNTVVRYARLAGGHARLAGGHARQLHDEFVAFSPEDSRGPVRREVVLRLPEAGALRPRRPGRRSSRRLLGSRGDRSREPPGARGGAGASGRRGGRTSRRRGQGS